MALSETSPESRIEALTHCNREGVPYRRDATVEQQILSALSLHADDLLARARITDKADPQYLQEETLAYLIRRRQREGDDLVVDGLAEVLVQRCTRYLSGLLRSLRQEQMQEAIAETLADLFERLIEPEDSNRADFLQVRFWVVVKRLGIAAFKRAVEESERAAHQVSVNPTGAAHEEEDEPEIEPAAPSAPPDARLLTEEALALLEPNVRKAFILRLEGWPIEDRDPTVPTISRLFGKTSRTIRYWLAHAEERLAAWAIEEPD